MAFLKCQVSKEFVKWFRKYNGIFIFREKQNEKKTNKHFFFNKT